MVAKLPAREPTLPHEDSMSKLSPDDDGGYDEVDIDMRYLDEQFAKWSGVTEELFDRELTGLTVAQQLYDRCVEIC